VRVALERPGSATKLDWNDTWVAQMFLSGKANELRKLELERRMGITPEIKRYNEIKAGVIVSSAGLGLAIFLHVFMKGIAGNVAPEAAAIITRLWIVGVIPFLIGVALMINGLVVSKRIVEAMDDGPAPRGLRTPNTSEFIPAGMSVTEHTTRHLSNAEQKVDR
jgi:hypothetical protein